MIRALTISAAMMFLIAALLTIISNTKDKQSNPTLITAADNLTTYHQPERLKQHQRPKITADEASHSRWVTRIDESSLRGSKVDLPNIKFNQHTIIELNPDLRFYFSYYTSLDGEMAPERIQQLAYDNMHDNYPAIVANELFDLFLRYQLYFQALNEHLNQLTPKLAQEKNLNEQKISQKLQKHFFSAREINALFVNFDKSLNFIPTGKLIGDKLREYEDTPDEYKYQKATELFGEEAAKRLTKSKEAN